MVKDLRLKAKIKNLLIIANTALVVSIVVLIAIWLLVIRPIRTELATNIEHYAFFNLNSLPEIANKMNAEYISDTTDQSTEGDYQDLAFADNKSFDNNDINIIVDNNSDEEIDLLETAQSALEHTKKIEAEIAQASKYIDHKQNQDEVVLANKISKIDQYEHIPVEVSAYKGPPQIALLITNLGLNRKSTKLSLSLPEQCGLGFLPYTKSLKPLLHQAQSENHEIFLYLPLQTSRAYDNPGKYALLGNLPAEENTRRLNVILNSHARYDGLYSSFKEIYTTKPDVSRALFDHLEDKNLIFIMGRINKHEADEHIKTRSNIAYTNIIIDDKPDKEVILANLNKLKQNARKNGKAIGYCQGYTLTIEMIKEWLPTLRQEGIELVPISKIINNGKNEH